MTVTKTSTGQAEEFLCQRYGQVERLEPLGGGFWSSAYGFSAGGSELVIRFGASREWFEADRAAMAFSSRELPVPAIIEIGEAFGGYYAISVRHHGRFLEHVLPD